MEFAIPTDNKLKENEKKNKYLDIAQELKQSRNMKVTIIHIMIGAFGTVTKGSLKGLEDLEIRERVETIQTIILLKMARILRRIPGLVEIYCHSKTSESPLAKTDLKKLSRSK